jgi:hypothetical protein
MARKTPIIDFEAEAKQHVDALRSQIGHQVPLSCSYVRGQKPTLLAIEGEFATLKFPNGAILSNVPPRDLVDDSAYWRKV